jgi:hypothetical protein
VYPVGGALREEKKTDASLTQIAESVMNPRAAKHQPPNIRRLEHPLARWDRWTTSGGPFSRQRPEYPMLLQSPPDSN